LAVLFRGCVFQSPQLPRPAADVLSERLGRVPRDRSEERGLPSLPTGSFLLKILATNFNLPEIILRRLKERDLGSVASLYCERKCSLVWIIRVHIADIGKEF
jgi:hypothetical protein